MANLRFKGLIIRPNIYAVTLLLYRVIKPMLLRPNIHFGSKDLNSNPDF